MISNVFIQENKIPGIKYTSIGGMSVIELQELLCFHRKHFFFKSFKFSVAYMAISYYQVKNL